MTSLSVWSDKRWIPSGFLVWENHYYFCLFYEGKFHWLHILVSSNFLLEVGTFHSFLACRIKKQLLIWLGFSSKWLSAFLLTFLEFSLYFAHVYLGSLVFLHSDVIIFLQIREVFCFDVRNYVFLISTALFSLRNPHKLNICLFNDVSGYHRLSPFILYFFPSISSFLERIPLSSVVLWKTGLQAPIFSSRLIIICCGGFQQCVFI